MKYIVMYYSETRSLWIVCSEEGTLKAANEAYNKAQALHLRVRLIEAETLKECDSLLGSKKD